MAQKYLFFDISRLKIHTLGFKTKLLIKENMNLQHRPSLVQNVRIEKCYSLIGLENRVMVLSVLSTTVITFQSP